MAICKDLRQKIDKILGKNNPQDGSFGINGAFAKMGEKAPTEAKWMNHDLCCHTADDVFYILKASTRVSKYLQRLAKSE